MKSSNFPLIEEKSKSRPSSAKISLNSSGPLLPVASKAKKPSAKLEHFDNEVEYEKALALFSDRHTKDLTSRQATTLSRIARSKKAGLRLMEIENVSLLMQAALERLSSPHTKDLFVEPLELFIRLFALPLVPELKAPELDKAALICSCFSVFEKVISLKIPCLTKAVAETLPLFANHSANTADPNENLKIILQADIIPALLRVFPEFVDVIVNCFHALSKYPLAALKMGESGLLNHISVPLGGDFRKESVVFSNEILLNIIESVPSDSFSAWFLPNAEAIITALRRLITDSLSKGHRVEDKESRNEFVVILSLLARIPTCASHFALCDILRPLLATVTAPELSALAGNGKVSQTGVTRPFTLSPPAVLKETFNLGNDAFRSDIASLSSSTDDLDLELKRLVWHLSALLIDDPFCHSQIAASQLLSCVLMFIDIIPDAKFSPSYNPHPSVNRWLLSQQLELQYDALRLVSALAPELPAEFVAQQGHQRLMNLVMFVTLNPANDPGRALTSDQCAALRVAALSCLAACRLFHLSCLQFILSLVALLE